LGWKPETVSSFHTYLLLQTANLIVQVEASGNRYGPIPSPSNF
jgi:hypothetical protein